ncbi:MAG: hypothetical protein HY736_25865 [Verrucomicrobia bacterium]|nr:hypothetical protein [Verrucomicrobiota bacterium]
MNKNTCWTILLALCLSLNARAAPADTVVVAGCRERLMLIESVDAKTQTPEQRNRLDFFKGLEELASSRSISTGSLPWGSASARRNPARVCSWFLPRQSLVMTLRCRRPMGRSAAQALRG